MGKAIVTASSLRLRSGPGTGFEIVRRLARGTTLDILEPAGAWLRVRAGADTGFVHGDFVRLLPDDADESAAFFREDPALATLEMAPDSPLAREADTPAERRVAKLWNRAGGLLAELARRLEVPVGLCVAVLRVESGGAGFRGGRMVIRFENHIFWRRWGKAHSERFHAHYRFDADQTWKGHRFRSTESGRFGEFHGNQDAEWKVLDFSRQLDDQAALESISMGAPQIMGFNHGRVGYASARELFDAFSASERTQIIGLFDFIRGPEGSSRMTRALQRGDLEQFAGDYNGSGQAARYAGLIAAELERFEGLAAG